jgi:nucleoside-diphosphate-sugar epimerase
MLTVGVLGASGFIGNRAVEMLLDQGYTVRPIVRTAASLAHLTRSNELDCRIANALDPSALQQAFTGCDMIIHSVLGSPGLIRGAAEPAYRAAHKAKVRRMIYLSTMCVHTQAPPVGTTESSPLSDRQPFPYNSAKIAAERSLLRLRKQGSVEVVIFRPGIVFGPKSRWIVDLANSLLQETAYLINDGQGVFNAVYVDNLIHAISLATTATDADGEAFFVGELEQVTWADFYRPVAIALGIDPDTIPHVPAPPLTRSWKKQLLEPIWDSAAVQKLLSLLSDEFKQTLKQSLRKRSPSSLVQPKVTKPKLVVTQEMAALQQGQYKLPLTKAEKVLGYTPLVSFPEACDRCIHWLAAMGYPVISK